MQFSKSVSTVTAVLILKLYGAISRPFGFKWLAWIGVFVGKFVKNDELAIVKLNSDTRYQFFLGDYYWNKLVCKKFVYEREIYDVLKMISGVNYSFLDLGANYGYWSCLVSSAEFGGKTAAAVEPVGNNYSMLCQNCELNHNRFTTIHAAVAREDGKVVTIHTNPESLANEGATLVSDSQYAGPGTEQVTTVSLDSIVETTGISSPQLVVKLDVEGFEVEALRGAKRVLRGEILIIYEDHGSDPLCSVSEYVLGLGLSVFHFEHRNPTRVTALDDVKAIKLLPNKGYNLFACHNNSKFFSIINQNQ